MVINYGYKSNYGSELWLYELLLSTYGSYGYQIWLFTKDYGPIMAIGSILWLDYPQG